MSKTLKTHMDLFSLTKEQLDFYKENGYLHLKEVWSKEETDILRRDLDEHAKGHFTNKLDAHYYKNLKSIHRGKKLCDIGDLILG